MDLILVGTVLALVLAARALQGMAFRNGFEQHSRQVVIDHQCMGKVLERTGPASYRDSFVEVWKDPDLRRLRVAVEMTDEEIFRISDNKLVEEYIGRETRYAFRRLVSGPLLDGQKSVRVALRPTYTAGRLYE